MNENFLEIKNLTKDYGNGKGALDVNISIKPGEIVGFVGPNGAGKSTTMEMIMSLIEPDNGTRKLFGENIKSREDIQKVIHRIGYLAAEGGLYENLTAMQTFKYAEQLYGINVNGEYQRLATELQLDLDKKIKALSLGNKKKVGIIQSIIHNPDLVILDEPTSGLDPLIQQQILKIIKDFSSKGRAIFLSSHNLAEVQSVCDRVIMIKNAKIIFDDKTENIIHDQGKEIKLINPPKIILDRIRNVIHDDSIKEAGNEVTLSVKRLHPIIKILMEYDFEDFYILKPSLEERFINMY
ncbi:ABC transporter ATP-binding protein [Candidatus Dojkabacteria bacterium]|uniref:ABC transporter ATP-binding protein n=1 Tax=Candidatus Dojkabacteria bacterium TaxID=2099670 RepID=A0A955RLQ6_9BACT|nr:ABC transporter ATP-binding protein [Candidatus Dojkabacteria bacterium]